MAVTKVLARKGRLDVGIRYVLNGDKTDEQILTAHLNCDPGHACRQMLDTKRAVGKTDGVQYIKAYAEQEPDDLETHLDSDGVRRMQPVMVPYNKAYAPKPASPELEFRIVGRVL